MISSLTLQRPNFLRFSSALKTKFIQRDLHFLFSFCQTTQKREFASQVRPLLCNSINKKTFTVRSIMSQKIENYGKVSSEAYGIWFPEINDDYEDAAFYRKFIKNGQPALEVGCGNGRLLIPFLSEGLEVEGLDLSPYMIEICKNRAAEKGLKTTFYQQAMQNMDIPRKFNTIFIPYGSFMLVHKLNEAQEALRKFYNHLNPGGKLIISLFIPTAHDIHVAAPLHDQWRLRREGTRGDGAVVKCWEKAHFDQEKQMENSQYRYEVLKDGKVIETENENLVLHWYTQDQFTKLLHGIGFKKIECVSGYSDQKAKPTDDEFTFIITK